MISYYINNLKTRINKIFFGIKSILYKVFPGFISTVQIDKLDSLKDGSLFRFTQMDRNTFILESTFKEYNIYSYVFAPKSIFVYQEQIYPELYDAYHFQKNNERDDNQYVHRFLIGKIHDLHRVYLVSTGGSDNYYHFIFDLLPKLLMISNKIISTDSLVIGDCIPVGKKIIQELNLNCVKIFRQSTTIKSKNMIIPFYTIKRQGNPDMYSLRLLREYYLKQVSVDIRLEKKYYIVRGRRQGRNITNEDRLIESLSIIGYEPIKLDNLDFIQQLSVFFNAKSILSIHGAGLTNIFICKSKTKIYEIFPKGFNGDNFRRISNTLHLDYKRYQISPNNARYDISISTEDLRLFLEA